jgi:hypothetical protein
MEKNWFTYRYKRDQQSSFWGSFVLSQSSQHHILFGKANEMDKSHLNSTMKTIKNEVRVIILFCYDNDFVTIMKTAHNLGILQGNFSPATAMILSLTILLCKV